MRKSKRRRRKGKLQDVEISERVFGGVELVKSREQPSRLGVERVVGLLENYVEPRYVSGGARKPLDLGHQYLNRVHLSPIGFCKNQNTQKRTNRFCRKLFAASSSFMPYAVEDSDSLLCTESTRAIRV